MIVLSKISISSTLQVLCVSCLPEITNFIRADLRCSLFEGFSSAVPLSLAHYLKDYSFPLHASDCHSSFQGSIRAPGHHFRLKSLTIPHSLVNVAFPWWALLLWRPTLELQKSSMHDHTAFQIIYISHNGIADYSIYNTDLDFLHNNT